jgi:hypothetical protein
MVIKMAMILITTVIKVLMISCNNYDERDTNSDGNSYKTGDKPSRSYAFALEAHVSNS